MVSAQMPVQSPASISSVIHSDPLLQQGWSVVPGSVTVTEGGTNAVPSGSGGVAQAGSAPVPQPDPGFSQSAVTAPTKTISATTPATPSSMNTSTAATAVPELEAF